MPRRKKRMIEFEDLDHAKQAQPFDLVKEVEGMIQQCQAFLGGDRVKNSVMSKMLKEAKKIGTRTPNSAKKLNEKIEILEQSYTKIQDELIKIKGEAIEKGIFNVQTAKKLAKEIDGLRQIVESFSVQNNKETEDLLESTKAILTNCQSIKEALQAAHEELSEFSEVGLSEENALKNELNSQARILQSFVQQVSARIDRLQVDSVIFKAEYDEYDAQNKRLEKELQSLLSQVDSVHQRVQLSKKLRLKIQSMAGVYEGLLAVYQFTFIQEDEEVKGVLLPHLVVQDNRGNPVYRFGADFDQIRRMMVTMQVDSDTLKAANTLFNEMSGALTDVLTDLNALKQKIGLDDEQLYEARKLIDQQSVIQIIRSNNKQTFATTRLKNLVRLMDYDFKKGFEKAFIVGDNPETERNSFYRNLSDLPVLYHTDVREDIQIAHTDLTRAIEAFKQSFPVTLVKDEDIAKQLTDDLKKYQQYRSIFLSAFNQDVPNKTINYDETWQKLISIKKSLEQATINLRPLLDEINQNIRLEEVQLKNLQSALKEFGIRDGQLNESMTRLNEQMRCLKHELVLGKTDSLLKEIKTNRNNLENKFIQDQKEQLNTRRQQLVKKYGDIVKELLAEKLDVAKELAVYFRTQEQAVEGYSIDGNIHRLREAASFIKEHEQAEKHLDEIDRRLNHSAIEKLDKNKRQKFAGILIHLLNWLVRTAHRPSMFGSSSSKAAADLQRKIKAKLLDKNEPSDGSEDNLQTPSKP